jgi:hypothetical protein
MQNQRYLKMSLAGLLILLLFTIATVSAEDIAVTTPPTPYQTLGTTPPTPYQTLGTTPPTPYQTLGTTPPTPYQTLGTTIRGNGVPLHPLISVVALCCMGFLIHRYKRK